MKTYLTTLAAIVAAIIIADPAHATGNHTPTPKPPKEPPSTPAPTPAPVAAAPVPTVVTVTPQLAAELTPSQVATLRQQAAAEAAAKAKAEADAQAAGTGTAALQQTDQSNIKTNVYAMGLPQPIQLAAMAGVTCPTPDITQASVYGLWGGFAGAKSRTSTDACVLMAGYAQYLAVCQFWSANILLGEHMAKLLPGFRAPSIGGLTDMTPEQCAAFRNPPVSKVAPPPAPLPPPPAPPAPPPEPKKVSLSADALFDFDKDVLKPAGKQRLDELAATLLGEAANIIITGHTDARGSDQYNDRLSMRRANAVRAHLALAGVDLGRMVALGKGKREPHCTERTEACHAENRRVDVQITVAAASPRLAALTR